MFNNLPELLLGHLQDSTVAIQVCSTYEYLMAQHLKEAMDFDEWSLTWIQPVIRLLEANENDSTIYYQRIIKNAFQLYPPCINYL